MKKNRVQDLLLNIRANEDYKATNSCSNDRIESIKNSQRGKRSQTKHSEEDEEREKRKDTDGKTLAEEERRDLEPSVRRAV